MFNKKILVLGVVLLLCSILAIGCGGGGNTQPPALTENDLDMANAYVVGDVFDKAYYWENVEPNYGAPTNGDGYYGPWGPGFTIPNDGTLVFNCNTTDTYFTMDLKTVPAAADTYQYVVVKVKVDNEANAAETLSITSLTIGNATHVSLQDWGITGLSTTYKTFVLKLADNGFTAWPEAGKGIAFIAMNQDGAAKAVNIIIDKIVLANLK